MHQNIMWLVRPAGLHTQNKMPFRWTLYVASTAENAALEAAKYRKAGGFEPRPTYEAVPMATKTGPVTVPKLTSDKTRPAMDTDEFQKLWDWDAKVLVNL